MIQILEEFLKAEATHYDLVELMVEFINCPHIRTGEFEGNEYVIKKLDRECLIIYRDLPSPSGDRAVDNAFAIYRQDLQAALVTNGARCGYVISKDLLVDGLIEW